MTNENLLTRLLAKEVRRRKRRNRMTYAVQWLLVTAFVLAASGWCLMLAVAVIHAAWVPTIPGLGYWWSVLLAALLRTALLPGSPSNRIKDAE